MKTIKFKGNKIRLGEETYRKISPTKLNVGDEYIKFKGKHYVKT